MGQVNIIGVQLTPLKIINTDLGDIFHGIKEDDAGYERFGEAYFSTVKPGMIKGWKRHKRMALNLIVPVGRIKFVLVDDREKSLTQGNIFEVELSRDNYQRLTISPCIWMSFAGMAEGQNILLNIASIPHDPSEVDKLPLDSEYIKYKWNR